MRVVIMGLVSIGLLLCLAGIAAWTACDSDSVELVAPPESMERFEPLEAIICREIETESSDDFGETYEMLIRKRKLLCSGRDKPKKKDGSCPFGYTLYTLRNKLAAGEPIRSVTICFKCVYPCEDPTEKCVPEKHTVYFPPTPKADAWAERRRCVCE